MILEERVGFEPDIIKKKKVIKDKDTDETEIDTETKNVEDKQENKQE